MTLLLWFGIGGLIAIVGYWPTARREWKKSMEVESRASAERLLAHRRETFSKLDPPVPTGIEEFAFRGYRYYDRIQSALEERGFVMLGDFALDHATWTQPGFRTFVRAMRSADGAIVATIIDATPHLIRPSFFFRLRFYLSGTFRRLMRMLTMTTELTDGRFITTATDADVIRGEAAPEILREMAPRDATVPELLDRHQRRVRDSGASVVPVLTVDDFNQWFVRHQRITRDFREKVGFAVTETEQRELADSENGSQKELANRIAEEMRKLEGR